MTPQRMATAKQEDKVEEVLPNAQVELAKERNHLANERTFQAWIRTSLSLMGLGFVIEQFTIFVRQNKEIINAELTQNGDYSWVIGKLLVIVAIVIILISYFRYHVIAKKIGYSKYFPARWLTGLVVVFIAIGISIMVYNLGVNF